MNFTSAGLVVIVVMYAVIALDQFLKGNVSSSIAFMLFGGGYIPLITMIK